MSLKISYKISYKKLNYETWQKFMKLAIKVTSNFNYQYSVDHSLLYRYQAKSEAKF